MRTCILGISAFYHDSAAAVITDGRITAAAQEERFSRKKHDAAFPRAAVRYVLAEAGLDVSDLTAVAFYDKPFLKFERLLETHHAFAPRGLRAFLTTMPVWIKEKLLQKQLLWRELEAAHGKKLVERPPLLFPEHHLSHAASAFYPSPFQKAAILTIDGVGEWATTTIGAGDGNRIRLLKELFFPHSLGLLYSAFTYYLGFRVNSGEYKLMGLAPYGHAGSLQVGELRRKIEQELVDLRPDGSFLMNMDYFGYTTGVRMCRDSRWHQLFGFPRRRPDTEFDQTHVDLALAIQQVTEEIVLRLARTARHLTGCSQLVMAGGVALNCVANGRLLRSGIFDRVWIQPAAGDAGGALGAAYAALYIWKGVARSPGADDTDQMRGSYLGPEFSGNDVDRLCRRYCAPATRYTQFDALCRDVAAAIAAGKVVGWFQGRMEWGPRALGNRSILADARNPEMQKRLNLKVKRREGFRPFAPSVLAEEAEEYFDLGSPSPYMLLVADVNERHRRPLPPDSAGLTLRERLYQLRSDIPAVTHVDYSARVQTVGRATNERFWHLLRAYRDLTGCGAIVNTSFNVRGEPIVCTPEDAYRCFLETDIDLLVIHDAVFEKGAQPVARHGASPAAGGAGEKGNTDPISRVPGHTEA